MALFGGSGGNVQTTFTGKDNLSPVVRSMKSTLADFRKNAMTGFGIGAGLSVFTAVTKAIDFAGDSLRAYADEQASVAKLTTAIKENATAWDGNMDAIEAVIKGRMRLGFADDEQRESLALLVAQVGDVNDALKIQRTAMDLARLKGMKLADASTLLAKAYNGSATGLQKMGIQLKKGTDGLEAIEAVQQRVAGQAQAYSETLAGSAEVMSVAFDEFKESVGGALSDALTPFFNMVVDLTNQAPDLDTSVGRLAQSYRDMAEAQKETVEQGQQQTDIFYDIYSLFAPQDRAIHDFTGTLAGYAQALGVSRKELALFTEAGLTAGKTLPELKAVLDELVSTEMGRRMKQIGERYGRAMGVIGDTTTTAIGLVRNFGLTAPELMSDAVLDMRETIKNGKAGIIEQFRDLAWQSKHPFAQKNYEDWLEGRLRAAQRKMRAAVKAGKGPLIEQYRRLVAAIQAELAGLPGYAAGVAADATAALGTIPFTDPGDPPPPPGAGPKKPKRPKKDRRPGDGPPTGRNAIGHMASGTRVVGEYGPEVVQFGSAKASVTTAQASRGDIVLQIDGHTLMRWIDNKQGRQMALYGLGD